MSSRMNISSIGGKAYWVFQASKVQQFGHFKCRVSSRMDISSVGGMSSRMDISSVGGKADRVFQVAKV